MFSNKTVLVTGGSRGIGRAICEEFSKKGANIVINYMGNEQKALETKEICEKNGVRAIIVKADVSNEQEVANMIDLALKEFKTIDILVNNAGITKDNLLMKMTEQDFSSVLDINLKGAFLCSKYVIRSMMKARYGKIINISSVVGVSGNAGQINYSASKAGIIGLTKSLAKEVASRNIYVNAIAPGFIKTDMTSDLSDLVVDTAVNSIPLKKIGEASDIAKTAVFLAESDYITGQVINVCGGMVI